MLYLSHADICHYMYIISDFFATVTDDFTSDGRLFPLVLLLF